MATSELVKRKKGTHGNCTQLT